MSINSELTKLDAVRDALVVSVNSKGGGLDADSTLWQVKQAVDGITIGVDAPAVTLYQNRYMKSCIMLTKE